MTKQFPALEPSTVAPDSAVGLAQRYLATAYDSVAGLIGTTYPALRAQRTGSRGRLTDAEHDLFRAAVVFAGAGVDAVLKEALRSCVPIQIEASPQAREKYIDFVVRHIQDGQSLDARRLAHLLTEGSPGDALRSAYVDSLTGSSLQSQEQVLITLAALGLHDERDLFKDAKALNALFRTRNQIAHEMDLTRQAVLGRRGRTRHERAQTAYIEMCHDALDYCQRVLNRLAAEVNSAVPSQ
jgi:hypothetical protein